MGSLRALVGSVWLQPHDKGLMRQAVPVAGGIVGVQASSRDVSKMSVYVCIFMVFSMTCFS